MVSTHTARVEGLFRDLSRKTLEAFESIKYARTYDKGALLFVEGQSPRGIFLLRQGRVSLSGSTMKGKRHIVKVAGPGDVLGLSATVSGKPHLLSAEAFELCHVSFVPCEDFMSFVKKHSDFCVKLAEQLAENFRAAEWLGLSLRGEPVNKRLANLLLEWKPTTGRPFEQDVRIDLPFSQEEIAETMGVTRETVSRAFSDLKKRGILDGKGSTWIICNESELKVIAGNYED